MSAESCQHFTLHGLDCQLRLGLVLLSLPILQKQHFVVNLFFLLATLSDGIDRFRFELALNLDFIGLGGLSSNSLYRWEQRQRQILSGNAKIPLIPDDISPPSFLLPSRLDSCCNSLFSHRSKSPITGFRTYSVVRCWPSWLRWEVCSFLFQKCGVLFKARCSMSLGRANQSLLLPRSSSII